MNFAIPLLRILKRIAAIEDVHANTGFNEDGVFGVELLAVIDGQVGSIATLTEDATNEQIAEFARQVELLAKAIEDERVEEDKRAGLIYEVLGKLSKEERELIGRPLPEDLPPEGSEGEDG